VRIWIDLSNSPHVALFAPIVDRLREQGHDVLLSARDHAQTLELARRPWPDIACIGGPSPGRLAAKARTIGARAAELARYARGRDIDLALSHGSYAQLAAARLLGMPAVTMMDYEFQPANHLSFRLARRVVVPTAFPARVVRECGAAGKTLRYDGYKEEAYLAGFVPDRSVLSAAGVDPTRVVAVLRPPPAGALYHRGENAHFLEVARAVAAHEDVDAVLLSRRADRERWLGLLPGAIVPAHAVDGPSLLALADLTVGGGGTMNRESALLGTPTYTVFGGRLAAVDAALIRSGLLVDLRDPRSAPAIVKKPAATGPAVSEERRERILRVLDRAIREAVGAPAPRRRPRPAAHRA
jgi:predicted glycosyltransferase